MSVAAPQPLVDCAPPADAAETFSYRPVPISAPVSLVLGVIGLSGFLAWQCLFLAAAGVVVGLIAWLTTRSEAYAGRWLAVGGLCLTLAALVGGTVAHVVAYQTEVPEGHRRLNFTEDVAEKAIAPAGGYSPQIEALDGEKVFLKGYMYPQAREEGITQFVFVKDSGECCFGGKPALTDMILVEMAEGRTADFVPNLTSVAGTFALRPDGGQPELDADPIFRITATHAGPAATNF